MLKEIIQGEKWLALPSKFDIHDYSIMESFCSSQQNPSLRDRLLSAIHGSGAFRRFREATEQEGVLEKGWGVNDKGNMKTGEITRYYNYLGNVWKEEDKKGYAYHLWLYRCLKVVAVGRVAVNFIANEATILKEVP
jgi:hypothetical protein